MATLHQAAPNASSAADSVYLNGEFLAPEQAAISPFDRGFIFGDGVYEVIPVFGGRLFRFAHHLQRLDNSLTAIGLSNPLAPARWREVLQRLVDDAGGGDQAVYLQITRGAAPRNHAFPKDAKSTVFAYAQAKVFAERPSAVSVITTEDIRWQRCDIKTTSLLAAVMLRERAEQAGALETILIRNGIVTEGAASNVFLVLNGVLVTPPQGPFILPGITRDLVLELARANGIPCEEREVQESELTAAQEVWVTSSTNEITPVTRINNKTVGDGVPGPMFQRLYGLYQNYKQAVREGKAE